MQTAVAAPASQQATDMISKFFIERPVLTNVLAIIMILLGAVALFNLPVAQYPDVVPPTGAGYEWTDWSYQEKAVGRQLYVAFALALVLVYLLLAGQYESWYAPIAVILAVPFALLGPVLVLMFLHIDNNLYVQIGLILLIALSAKNAILIVEMARECRVRHGQPLLESAVAAARSRFRPILMTSFAFILGVAPLVAATGAGASARKSIGITVFSGMIASTCLAVL
jgi:hydrophobic/amphiphilic exporter-1 (mainly G- bacteria), HAE1 family